MRGNRGGPIQKCDQPGRDKVIKKTDTNVFCDPNFAANAILESLQNGSYSIGASRTFRPGAGCFLPIG